VCEYRRMNSPEDPEERIRQLEQSAAGYGAVELGGQQPGDSEGFTPTAALPPPVYGNPPPYGNQPPYGSPPSYGDAYMPPAGTHFTPIQKKGGVPVGLIVGLVAVVLIAVFGGIAAFVWNMTSTVESNTTNPPSDDSSVAGGGGSVDKPDGTQTDSPPSIAIPNIPGIPGIPDITNIPGFPGGDTEETATPGGQFSVAGIDGNKTVACNESNVSISGVNNTVTLTGHCLSITVSGIDNKVSVDSTDKIGASGFDNEIIYHSGDPQIDATASNTVLRG
jgi:hypothetical protein